jgi:hypothetical protein
MAKITTVGEGSGISARTRRLRVLDGSEADDAAEAHAAFRQLDRLNEPWGRHAKFIEAVKSRYDLLKTSVPADPHEHLEATRPRTSEFSYLFQCVRYVRLVEKHIESRPWEAVSLAMDLMELLTEFSFKEAYESDALDGQTMREGRVKGGKSRRKQPREERLAFVNNLLAQKVSKREAMRKAASHFGVSYGAIRNDLFPKK